jgi:hypothetical protein
VSRRFRFPVFPGAAIAALAACLGTASAQEPRVNPDAQLMVEFNERVNEYVDLHRKLEKTLPTLPTETTPERIDEHQRSLERLIQRARTNAKPGEVFTKNTRALFRRNLGRVFTGPQGEKLKASIMDENPGPIRLTVNGRYPDAVPLPTVPPQVLEVLPKLPPELEYRFIGDRLILLDVHAHTIVDIMEDPLPR